MVLALRLFPYSIPKIFCGVVPSLQMIFCGLLSYSSSRSSFLVRKKGQAKVLLRSKAIFFRSRAQECRFQMQTVGIACYSCSDLCWLGGIDGVEFLSDLLKMIKGIPRRSKVVWRADCKATKQNSGVSAGGVPFIVWSVWLKINPGRFFSRRDFGGCLQEICRSGDW